MAYKMKGPFLYKSTMKLKNDQDKVKKAADKPTASEIAIIKAHNQALKDNPELYEDSFYDKRREKVKKIKSKYPKYNF